MNSMSWHPRIVFLVMNDECAGAMQKVTYSRINDGAPQNKVTCAGRGVHGRQARTSG